MSKTFYKEISVECDIHKEDGFCWIEDTITLNMRDFPSKAYSILSKRGWIIGKKKDVCPYCSKGKSRFISEIEDNNYPNKKGF